MLVLHVPCVPSGPKFLHFYEVFGTIGQIVGCRPLGIVHGPISPVPLSTTHSSV